MSIVKIVLALAGVFVMFKIGGFAESQFREVGYKNCVENAKDMRQQFLSDDFDGETLTQRAAKFGVGQQRYVEEIDALYKHQALECAQKRRVQFFTLAAD